MCECWVSENGQSAQGWIIPVNLSTRLTQKRKTSHEIFIGSPTLCCENNVLAKYQKNKILSLEQDTGN